jgi:hypothetical protein
MRVHVLTAATLAALPPAAAAQGAVFQTPGMPSYPAPPSSTTPEDSSQASRFSSVFNPAFSFVVDVVGDYLDSDGSSDDGFDLELRTLELTGQSWVDPNAWAYFVAATDGDELGIEEAAIHYTGLGGNSTIRAGRFFIDFGKQMQTHVHELRTIERPLVLRTYLGEEVKGDGVQWDHWIGVGDSTAVRWSIGVFADLLPEESDDFDPELAAEPSVDDRKDAGDLNFTARLTAFTDVGESGTLQFGTSARLIPDYTLEFEPSGDAASGLSNSVFGLDATYGWANDTGLEHWTLGTEYLFDSGDDGSSILDSGTPADPTDDTIDVFDESVGGYYAFVDYAWSPFQSAGVQYSQAEIADGNGTELSEIELYYTRKFSEYHRLRFDVSSFDSDLEDEDSLRFAIQYTAFVGAHGHGVNW